MTRDASATAAPIRPTTRTPVFLLRSALLAGIVAALLWPMYRGELGPLVLGVTCGLALLVTTASYLVSIASLSWSPTWQYGVLMGGFFVRMVVVVGAVLGMIVLAELPAARTVLALIAFYLVLLFHEAWTLYRRVV